jgi:hypothetical protein
VGTFLFFLLFACDREEKKRVWVGKQNRGQREKGRKEGQREWEWEGRRRRGRKGEEERDRYREW